MAMLMSAIIVLLAHLVVMRSWVGAATNFCSQPLGMKTRIIADSQISESSYVNWGNNRRGYQARLDNNQCWCADQSKTIPGEWVKVDFKQTFSITGITIQGEPGSGAANYIKKFKLRYSVNLIDYVYVIDPDSWIDRDFTGATGQNQKIDVMFPSQPFSARVLEFRPTASNGDHVCVRFEVYGCNYVCGQGLGLEHGNSLPSGFAMTSSSSTSGRGPTSGRLNSPSAAWCASGTTNEFLQIDLGKLVTVSGIATQGDPGSASWVTGFKVDYGTTLGSLTTYDGSKVFIGNSDQNTIVVNWFRVRLVTRYIKIKPTASSSAVCMRIEVLGCNTDSVYEFGAENRALPDNRFSAYAYTDFTRNGRYHPKDGRLNNDRPWARDKKDTSFLWFKIDLGRVVLVTAVATQGDRTYGKNYFPDFKLQYTLDSVNTNGSKITIKEETSLTEKVFTGNTNSAGVKFNLLDSPVSTRYIQFIKHSNVLWDYALTVEVYGIPQMCTSSFGMVAGEPDTNNPTVRVSSGTVPDKRSKINTQNSWCASTTDASQYFQYDFGAPKMVSGFAIQGDPWLDKWVKTFKVKYGTQEASLATYQERGSDKTFSGCRSRDEVIYHWFSTTLKTRYLRVAPLTWETAICLRMNAFGCPKSECHDAIGLQSSSTIPDASMTASTFVNGNEPHKGRLNLESVWAACQFGSCSSKESSGAKPWIQTCFSTVQTVTSIVIQGQGNVDNLAKATEFSLKFSYVVSGTFHQYKYSNGLEKFAGPPGRYSSSQVDLPHAVIARCIRLQVETQSPNNQNVGLRWEMLGCASVAQVASISVTPASPSVARNGEVTLTCAVAAQPGVEATWKNGSSTVTTSGIHRVGNDVISNGDVNGQTTKELKITATPNIVLSSFATCTIADRVECKQSYECSAMYPGISSTSKSSTIEVTVTGIIAKPTKPSGIRTSLLTNTSATITWSPSVSDYPTVGYTVVLKKKSDGSVIETRHSIGSTTAAFPRLSVFTDYTTEISAKSLPHNLVSDTGIFDFKTDQGVSSPPSMVSMVALSSKSIQVSWSAPSPLNGVLHDYKVRYKITSTADPFNVASAGSKLALNISSLQPFSKYQAQVAATTKNGQIFGNWSLVAEVNTPEGASSPPLNVSLLVRSSTSIRVSWLAPLSVNGILHDYRVRYKMTSAAAYNGSISAGKSLTLDIPSLEPFVEYEVQVSATTKKGEIVGDWSKISIVRTHQAKPTRPRNLTITNIQSTSVFVNFSKPLAENGIITYYTLRYSGSKSYNSSFSHVSSTTIYKNTSSEFTGILLTGLVPATDYKIDVAATTGGGQGEFSTSKSFQTAFATPLKPVLESLGRTDSILKVRLGVAWDLNGPISEYELYITEGSSVTCQANGAPETILSPRIPLQLEFKPGIRSVQHISTELKTLANYTLCYRAVSSNQGQKYYSQFSGITIERKYLRKMDINVYKQNATSSSFVIPLAAGPANTKSYHVIVLESKSLVKDPDQWKPTDLGPYDSSTYVAGKPYVTAVLSSFTSKFEIGDGKEYSPSSRRRRNVGGTKYTNVPLKADTEYIVFQRAYVSENAYYSSPWIGPFKTSKKISSKPIVSDPPIGAIVGSIIPIIIIIALIPAVWYIRKRRLSCPKSPENGVPKKPFVPLSDMKKGSLENRSYEDEDEASNDGSAPISAQPEPVRRRHSSGVSLKHRKVPHAVGNDQRHPPVSLQDFTAHSKELQKDSHHMVTEEFEDLPKGQLYTWDVATNATNKPKNRYANIAAYDHSRVHLKPLPGIHHSDYFNASHILGYYGQQKYLASQGPTDLVLYDFWRMVWDKNVPAIVMLTNLVERGKRKCSQYWPDFGSETYGKITVTLASIENYVDYTIRCLSVQREGCKETKTVYQYHFVTWPDYGIPETPTDLLNLRAKFRKQFPYAIEDPIVVHCSAGVGRTGTFIVIDTMLDLVQNQRRLDIFNYLSFIRSQRIHLIQVEEQYIFVYKSLVESITCGKTEIETQNLRIQINQLQTKDNSGKTGFEQQFERLQLTTTYFPEAETSTGSKAVNKPKNRRADIVPKDINRIILQQSIYENDGASDYVNATYVNGYRQKNAFIATQHPLPETIEDFWLMIQQTEVTIIVLLNRLNDGRESLPVFWPAPDQTAEYGKVFVCHKSESNEDGFVERKFVVSHDQSREACKNVTMFHFQSWPDHCVPKDASKLLSFVNQVEKCQQQQSNDQPIVVMCRDGAGRTGTFIAISFILERFKTEQLVDVFQTIKKARAFRPQFVENSTQYKFCHTITQAFIDSFDTYANFSG